MLEEDDVCFALLVEAPALCEEVGTSFHDFEDELVNRD